MFVTRFRIVTRRYRVLVIAVMIWTCGGTLSYRTKRAGCSLQITGGITTWAARNEVCNCYFRLCIKYGGLQAETSSTIDVRLLVNATPDYRDGSSPSQSGF